MLGIDKLARSLQATLIVDLVDEHVGLHGCGMITDRNNIGSGVFRPYGAPVLTTHVIGLGQRIGFSIVLVVVERDGIIGHQHYGCSIAYSLDS